MPINQKIEKDIRQTGKTYEKISLNGQIINANFAELRIILSAKTAQKLS